MTNPYLTGLLLVAALGVSGCASGPDPRDPMEPMNRAIHAFNEKVDEVVLKPLAEGYVAITPSPVRTGVRNFFSNLDDVLVFSNDVLQLKPEAAASDLMRVAFNTSFGVFGVLDVATEMGLRKRDEDFGQTLGYWGIGDGPYFVMPLLGPKSVRDTVGWAVDAFFIDPVAFNAQEEVRWAAVGARLVARRADLLDAKRAIDMAALDPYEFQRDFYLEHRRALVYDGKPPPAAE
jgi:phospholipid-binding lipoprotein MlaA